MSLKLRLLGLTAVGLVFTAPALAQTVLNPQQITGANSQTGNLSLSSAVTGLTATAIGNQANSNSLNQLGASSTALNANTATFAFGQVAGPIAGGANTDSFSQSAINGISSTSSGGFLSNVTAGLSGGNQSATNTTNSATFNILSGSSGTLQQAVNVGATSSQTADNTLSASAISGNATVNGAGNSQIASNGLNTAAGLISSDGATLGLDQKAPPSLAALHLYNYNTATANVNNGTNPAIDPTVSNLSQTASSGLNTLATSGGPLTLTNGGDNQGQVAGFAGSSFEGGNLAHAYTGPGPAFSGVGTSAVNNVNQSYRVAINTLANDGSTTYGNLAAPFLQTSETSYLAVRGRVVDTPSGTLFDQVNAMVASTHQGGSAVTGAALSADNSTATQYRGVAINDAASTGAVSGNLNQTSSDYNGGAGVLANTASSIVTGSGASSVTNVSQAQNLTMNTASGAGGNALTLQQSALSRAGIVTLGGANVQSASTPVGVASVTGTVQQMGTSVNGAHLGGVVNGTVQQSASAISQSTGNTLAASGGAGLASGSQSSGNSVNVVR